MADHERGDGVHVGTRGMPRMEREAGILDAAAAEFGTQGYHVVTIDAIAARAGISKPLVHAYFGTKDSLYVQCVERLTDQLVDAITPVVTDGEPGVPMAIEAMRTVLTLLEGRTHAWMVLNDPTIPRGSAAHAAVEACRARVVELGAVGARAVLPAGAADDPLDPEMMNDVWQAVVTAMVGFWLDHPAETSDQLTDRFARIVEALVNA